jgi:purine-binding chemotaxis protein CheW
MVMSNNQPQQKKEKEGYMSNKLQILTFLLNGEVYGFDIMRVQEIKDLEPCTPIPNSPDYTRGVMNLRGSVVPVFDLRRRYFGINLDEGVTIVIRVTVDGKEKTIGIVVDAVSNTEFADIDQLQSAPKGRPTDAFVVGLVSMDDMMVILINVDKMELI